MLSMHFLIVCVLEWLINPLSPYHRHHAFSNFNLLERNPQELLPAKGDYAVLCWRG